MKKIIVSLFCLFSVGCISRPTTENYEKYLQTLIGTSQADLIKSWGIPTKSYTSDDMTMLSYDEFGPSILVGQVVIPITCTTTFTLKNGVISSWNWKGKT